MVNLVYLMLIFTFLSSGLDVYDSESESSGSEKENNGRGYDSDEELRVRYFLLH